jgi:hypothetical protein
VHRRLTPLLPSAQFYATDAGRAHFANQLKSIRYCVQEVPFGSRLLRTPALP